MIGHAAPLVLSGDNGGVDHLDILAKLAEIVHQGAPEQQRFAQALIDRIGDDVPGSWDEAARLIDAYLNDPYLTRNAE
jgi:hypothetical protein